ncbi:hypothetical protein SKAU_G00184080 [Synaphobranchus kaupii]|uniref:Uncharacterized protein n=1 Tax=Synaphobranchus kaupii TaxID=118154 RepID=A0A9Q1IVP4_SYNKA|nr:hypothetical protein SKAU_G00184080 [Synaphobranchus kaupii]
MVSSIPATSQTHSVNFQSLGRIIPVRKTAAFPRILPIPGPLAPPRSSWQQVGPLGPVITLTDYQELSRRRTLARSTVTPALNDRHKPPVT